MCEFCTQHGEGKRWYLNLQNYAADLLDEVDRKGFIRQFYQQIISKGSRNITRLEKMFKRTPAIHSRIAGEYTRQMKKDHFGQVVAKEELTEILSSANSIVRMACACRWEAQRRERRSCFGVSFGPPHWYDEVDMQYFGSPEVSRFEALSKHEARQAIDSLDAAGLVHSVWTFQTPFIGAICNCDAAYCLAMRTTCALNMATMFRGEEVAIIDAQECTGCRACIEKCQFKAIQYLEAERKCQTDLRACYGGGVCRSACEAQAIALVDRSTRAECASLW